VLRRRPGIGESLEQCPGQRQRTRPVSWQGDSDLGMRSSP
jgi:hypothetical protein